MGQMGDMQEKMKVKLAEITVSAEAGDGAITVTADGNRTITNISIDPDKIDTGDREELEDLLLVAVNRALEAAAEKEASEGQRLMQDMLPPGLSGMFGGM
jgi:DNA-binding YbaB/EbfC family protein